MNLAQMRHQRTKAALVELMNNGRKRTAKQRAALQSKLDAILAYERANPWIVA